MLRGRDGIYGDSFTSRVEGMGIEEIHIAPRSPWQNCYVERVIGSVRRECLNHVIVFNDNHLLRLLKNYFRYYHESRTHLSLNKDAPECRAIQRNGSARLHKSVDCTINMSDAPHRQSEQSNELIVSLARLNECFEACRRTDHLGVAKTRAKNLTLRLPMSSSAHQRGHCLLCLCFADAILAKDRHRTYS
jgi:hypothetical protein